jgi:integrase
MTRFRLKYLNAFRDRHGRLRHYFRRPGCKSVALPGLPGSTEFMEAYRAALEGETAPRTEIGASRTEPATVSAFVLAYLDCSPTSTSHFKNLATETQRTRRNILENFREAHGDKRVYRTETHGRRVMLLTREHVQRIVNEKSDTPFAQRNFLNTLRALFRWAVAEGRVPDDPTLGVTRQQIKSTGYPTWSEGDIEQYKRRHPLGTMARLAIELLLTTAARRGDVVKFGPQHVEKGTITFEQHKKEGAEDALVIIPLHPDFCAALEAMPPSKVVSLTPTFLTTSFGKPFARMALPIGRAIQRPPIVVDVIRARTLPLQPLTKAANVKGFHELREYAVAEQDSSKPREIRQRQRDHPQMLAERRERQIDAKRHDAGR